MNNICKIDAQAFQKLCRPGSYIHPPDNCDLSDSVDSHCHTSYQETDLNIRSQTEALGSSCNSIRLEDASTDRYDTAGTYFARLHTQPKLSAPSCWNPVPASEFSRHPNIIKTKNCCMYEQRAFTWSSLLKHRPARS
jgi:hypothetical protein